MSKRIITFLLIMILFASTIPTVEARSTEKLDVHLDPNDFVADSLTGAFRYNEVSFKIDSDHPVDIYIMTNEDYRDDVVSFFPNYKHAKYSEKNVSSTSFTYKIPDDALYVLVISNPHNQTAIIDYKITYPESKRSDDNGLGGCICVSLIIIAVLILVYYFLWYRKGKKWHYPVWQYLKYTPPEAQEPPMASEPAPEPPSPEAPRARSVDEVEQEPPLSQ